MGERKIYHAIPGGRNKFHSAILTSFSFSFHHFEYQVLKTLKNKWVTNVGVLADAGMLDNAIGLTSAGLRQLTQSYSIDGIKSKGAFHPKINFLAGDKELLMVMGSGNITGGGHGKNHEVFTVLYADSPESSFLPLLMEAWSYLQYFTKELEGYSKERIINIIPKNCELFRSHAFTAHSFIKVEEEMELALLYNDSTSLFSQLLQMIPQDSIKIITIVCPYFDADGLLLLNLLNKFPNAMMEVYIPASLGLPPNKMAVNKKVSFFSWENTKRGKIGISGADNFDRKLHCKIFNFQSDDNEYCLVGSPNATIAAFGTESARGINDEFAILYKSPGLNFLAELDINGSKHKVKVSDYSRTKTILLEAPLQERQKQLARILSCDLSGLEFRLCLKEQLDELQMSFVVYNDSGSAIYRKAIVLSGQKNLSIRINSECLELNPAYITLVDDKGNIISNKKVINWLDKLYNTDPSKENRSLRSLISELEVGKLHEFEILSYMVDLNSGERKIAKVHALGVRGFVPKEKDLHAEMTYEEAMLASKNKEHSSRLTQMHNSVRLCEAILQLLKDKNDYNTEELNDEEEEGNASMSRERNSSFNISESIKIKNNSRANEILSRSERLCTTYVRTTHAILYDRDLKINEIFLCQFVLISHVLTAIHHFTQYEFVSGEKENKADLYTLAEFKELLKNEYFKNMQQVLLAFSRFILAHELETYDEDKYRSDKLNAYLQKALCHALISNFMMNRNGIRNPQSDVSNLACLNIFKKLGLPDEHLSDYIESISKSNADTLFNYMGVSMLSTELCKQLSTLGKEMDLYYFEKYGVCLKKTIDGKMLHFKSILDPNQVFRKTL